jgi:Na+/H+-dicarboxylate symporter
MAGCLGIFLALQFMGFLEFPPGVAAGFQGVVVPEGAMEAARSSPLGIGEWLVNVIPRNPFQAAAEGNLLQLLVFTVLLGAATSRLPEDARDPLGGLFRSSAEAMLILVSWVLWFAPLGVFSLVLNLALQAGFGTIQVVGYYILLGCLIPLVAIGLLYPLAVFGGRTSMRSFARAVAPAQMVAASTQSSLASLPALIKGGTDHLGLPEESTGFVLPLSAATFKMSTVIHQSLILVFLATVFEVPLPPGQLASFLFAMILLSFTTVGIPRGGGTARYLPFFLAAGVPVEGFVLVVAAKTIPDVFLSVLNSTAYMTVATVLSRKSRVPAPAGTHGPHPVPVPGKTAQAG